MAFIIVSFTSIIVAYPLLCIPWAVEWNPTVSGHCSNIIAFAIAANVIHMATDILIFVAPIHMVRSLSLRPGPKMVLIGTFALGFL